MAAAALLVVADLSLAAGRPASRRLGEQGGERAATLVISGPIGPGTYRRFMVDLERKRPSVIVLDGPGGRILDAMMIGTEIRRRGLATMVLHNRSCASACALIFLSGGTRYIDGGARIGVHSAANSGREDPGATAMMVRYLASMGVPAGITRKLTATPSRDMRWLTHGDHRALGLRRYG